MEDTKILPDLRYRTKLFVVGTLSYGIPAIAVLVIAAIAFSANDIALSDTPATVFFGVFGAATAITWILLGLLIPPYFRSISYELTDSEIIVRKGIVTKVVKTVPYRTVTNIVESRDLLDRYAVNLGSIKIQTAGRSGETGYEASLAGLSGWDDIHKLILAKLRAFRGGMTPTTTQAEEVPGGSDLLRAILAELKAIRASLASKD